MLIPSYEERLKKITSLPTLLEQKREAQQTVTRVKSWIRTQLPVELRMVPNASRMLPHLQRKLRAAQEVERMLQRDFYKIKTQVERDHNTSLTEMESK